MKKYFKIAFTSDKFKAGFVVFFGFLLFLSVYSFLHIGEDPLEMSGQMFESPSDEYILGTDNFGRDVLAELVAGSKNSLYIGFLAGIIASLIGISIGLLAGYLGGIMDHILSLVTNIFIVIPAFVILVLVSVSLDSKSSTTVALIIGATSWPWTARAVRAQTLSLRSREHVNLSKLSGHSTMKIILSDIMPYLASYIVMAFIMQVSAAILSESSVSILGLGAQNTATLGNVLNWAIAFNAVSSGYWWAFLPVVLAIALISFSLNLMNAGLDQVFNPRLRR
ncbi:ABC transporter permease [Tissierella praeacuta]|uniref:ABC transporter permease n=1 Tax=Tissierella praeacuta TaxID=43131 RepID=UPI00333EA6BC